MANSEHLDILKQGVETWNMWRDANPDAVPDLTGIDLSETDLRLIHLGEANLAGTNFKGANISESYLTRASLRGADLTRANLSRTFLTHADLREAVFTYTDLCEALLGKAKIGGAIFRFTKLGYTDLTSTEGLELVRHEGPSSLGVDTLFLMEDKLPDVFLRGCGVPEELIAYLPGLLKRPVEFYSCFISYSQADKAFARQLHDFLQGRGVRCWLDDHQLLPGHDIHDEVDRGIKMWDKTLLCASKASLTSWWVDKEITHAFAKERRLSERKGKKVRALVPLNLDGYILDGWQSSDADEVRTRLAADFIGWKVRLVSANLEINHITLNKLIKKKNQIFF